ncbi:winged helix-turn-helix transcriptional regulator [Rhodobacterales bacterium HKCCE2091]|nr:winged helix-turn-helix transcriptional regulator [Rhodobacterales bacterium HKCCE2091]
MELTEADTRILRALQRDGRISNQDLAERARMSASSCWRRVRDLEAAGVITGYRATIDPEACGMDFHALVQVELSRHEPEKLHLFTDAIATRDEIVDCFATTGDADYHLRVICRSKEAYFTFLEDFLFQIPVIARVRTNLILKETKRHGRLALDAP